MCCTYLKSINAFSAHTAPPADCTCTLQQLSAQLCAEALLSDANHTSLAGAANRRRANSVLIAGVMIRREDAAAAD